MSSKCDSNPPFPPDIDRHRGQHGMWKQLLGGLFPPGAQSAIHALLQINGARILDIGPVIDSWAVEVAQQFPRTQVVLLNPTVKQDIPPQNLSYVEGSVHDYLEKESGLFSIIHCRQTLLQFDKSCGEELLRLSRERLVKRGLLLVADGTWTLYSSAELKRSIQPTDTGHGIFTALWTRRHVEQLEKRGVIFGTNIASSLEPDSESQVFPCPLGPVGEHITNEKDLQQITGANFINMAKTSPFAKDILPQIINEIKKGGLYVAWVSTWVIKT